MMELCEILGKGLLKTMSLAWSILGTRSWVERATPVMKSRGTYGLGALQIKWYQSPIFSHSLDHVAEILVNLRVLLGYKS